jgi:hypothetical protein
MDKYGRYGNKTYKEGLRMKHKPVTAAYVRANFPACTQFADNVRAVFGVGVKMVYAKENGKELGELTEKKPGVNLSNTCIAGSLDDD